MLLLQTTRWSAPLKFQEPSMQRVLSLASSQSSQPTPLKFPALTRYLHSQSHLSCHPRTHVYIPLILSGPSQQLLWDSVSLFHTYYICSDHPTSYHLQSLCIGISDSRLSPLQYFLASTVDNEILCAWLFPPEDSKSLKGQDGIFLFIMYSRAWFLAWLKDSIRTSLVAQIVMNLPAVWKTWIHSLGREDPPGRR